MKFFTLRENIPPAGTKSRRKGQKKPEKAFSGENSPAASPFLMFFRKISRN
jgi:hypothetical protein